MRQLNIIIVPQEYESANHKHLWQELSNQLKGEVLIIDIPADFLVTSLKKKNYRKIDAKLGKKSLNSNLSILRPFFLCRPVIVPRIFNRWIANSLFKQIEKFYPDLESYHINVLSYSGKWIDILSASRFKTNLFYYIMDEVKYHAYDSKENKKAIKYDDIGCEKSNFVFTMSDQITNSRDKFRDKIMTIGNGSANVNINEHENIIKFKKSVLFSGHFRDWLDIDMLSELINNRTDFLFAFLGRIETKMEDSFYKLLNNNKNMIYLGTAKKEDVMNYYRMFGCVIVPYKQNEFIHATRPIKIVESIFSGTPVVTIPMKGYDNNSFIRFAKNAESFSKEIDYLLQNPINVHSQDYIDFISKNSWEYKAKLIAEKLQEKE